jgi:hypothetical protein
MPVTGNATLLAPLAVWLCPYQHTGDEPCHVSRVKLLERVRCQWRTAHRLAMLPCVAVHPIDRRIGPATLLALVSDWLSTGADSVATLEDDVSLVSVHRFLRLARCLASQMGGGPVGVSARGQRAAQPQG